MCQTAALSSREPVEAANSGPLVRPPWYVSIASEVRPQDTTVFLQAVQEDDDVSLTETDRAYLKALEAWLDMYPEMRSTR